MAMLKKRRAKLEEKPILFEVKLVLNLAAQPPLVKCKSHVKVTSETTGNV